MNPSKSKVTVLCQIAKLIPRNSISKLANEYGVSGKSRTFSPISYVLELMFSQLSHALGLNNVCDLYKARWAIEVFFKEIKSRLYSCRIF